MIGWFCLKVNSILAQFLQNLFCCYIPGVIGFRVQGGCRYISGVRQIVVAPLESIAATLEYQPREPQSVEKIVETRVIVRQRASRNPRAVFVLRVSIRVDIVGVNDLWLVHIQKTANQVIRDNTPARVVIHRGVGLQGIFTGLKIYHDELC